MAMISNVQLMGRVKKIAKLPSDTTSDRCRFFSTMSPRMMPRMMGGKGLGPARRTVSITKSYQRIKGQDIITDPKTAKSNRVVKMPDFLSQEMQDFIGQLYGIGEDDRMFMITKSYLHHEMDRGAKESGVKRIRKHNYYLIK